MKTDVCIIGAGSAGIFASIFASENGVQTLIVEGNTSAGRKLLRTGRGRCNLTHSGTVQEFIKAYGAFGRFLRHSLYELSAEKLREYFALRGLETKIEQDGCIFPVSDRAADVARILNSHAQENKVRFIYGKKVTDVEKKEDRFFINASNFRIQAKKVIIATGGVTWPFTGSTGDGYLFAKTFGHTIIEPRAALSTLVTLETWIHQLEGVGVNNVAIKTRINEKRICVSGPLMFTQDGIGGPCAFELSRFITDYLPDGIHPIKISIDFLPQYDFSELDKKIVLLCDKNPKKEVVNILTDFIPKSLADSLCRQAGILSCVEAGQLTQSQRYGLVKIIKELPLFIISTGPIADATVTRGGVSNLEINPRTMESKLCEGLFFAGEVINADGPCGGYNLQIAFSTGHLAGKSAAGEFVKNKI